MGSRVFGAIAFTEATLPVGTREAKKDSRLQPAFIAQRKAANEPIPPWFQSRTPELRAFIAWDGEGWTDETGQHHYMLFGCSTGAMVTGQSLSTRECLDLMLAVERDHPNAYHVWFAGNYDVNMILRDVSLEKLQQLKGTNECRWGGYKISWLKGKSFTVSRKGVTCRIDDTFTFYGTSFVVAVKEYLGNPLELAEIEAGKAKRSGFQLTDMTEIVSYWRRELQLMVALTERLREYLAKAGIYLHRWHGPGAVATAILKRHSHKHTPLNPAIHRAAQYAYSGGRFEMFRIGRHRKPVYQYDIRSAYPYAISLLPDLDGQWTHTDTVSVLQPFAIYRASYNCPENYTQAYPHPLFWRNSNGAVFYPRSAHGWYWGCELQNAPNVTVHEGWIYTPASDARPFAWIADMYRQRAIWKAQKEPAQLALKLGMNSIYGKLAQQIGWRFQKNGAVKIPTFHQLEYAGYITALTRSMIHSAMMQKPYAVIACETDSVCLTEPITLNIGTGLGQWEATEYEEIMYLQSGVYWARQDGEWKRRTRGFSRTALQPEQVEAWLAQVKTADQATQIEPLTVTQTRFNALGLHLGKDSWRRWSQDVRELRPGTALGKRMHVQRHCTECARVYPRNMNKVLHTTAVPNIRGIDYTQFSEPYNLKWEIQSDMQEWMTENDSDWITEDMA